MLRAVVVTVWLVAGTMATDYSPGEPLRVLFTLAYAALLAAILSRMEPLMRPASKWRRLGWALLAYSVLAILFVAIGYRFHAFVFAPLFALITATFIFLDGRRDAEPGPAVRR